jgi:hypothetical protein
MALPIGHLVLLWQAPTPPRFQERHVASEPPLASLLHAVVNLALYAPPLMIVSASRFRDEAVSAFA